MASVNPALEYISTFEKWGRLVLRPTLRIRHGGIRAVETVDVYYAENGYHPIDSPGSTASAGYYGTKRTKGKSRYIRAWVYNCFGFPAHNCQVLLERILFNGKPIEIERSPLHWTDYKDAYEYPQVMRRGHKNGWYIDIFASDSIDPRLQVLSLKATRGYHRFDKAGLYTIDLSAEATKPCSFGRMTMTVRHDAKDWENLIVVSAKEVGPFSRLW